LKFSDSEIESFDVVQKTGYISI